MDFRLLLVNSFAYVTSKLIFGSVEILRKEIYDAIKLFAPVYPFRFPYAVTILYGEAMGQEQKLTDKKATH